MMRKFIKENKKVFILIVILIILISTSITASKKVESLNQIEMNSIENISMIIKEGTLTKTSASIIITDTTGYNTSYSTPKNGFFYRIEKKINDNWKEINNNRPKMKDNIIYATPDLCVDKNNQLELDIDWSNDYGELNKGKYRLIKCATILGKLYEFSVEFEII